ncbi:lipopolysaccharide assembly protein LapA domain-containing protein [Amycolatopsis sp. QT-25]|uniref:LapA family protein n=1 Tax=Amycolatopsis sp. QT-25 TaxID=3034022 RepID=UPI0023ED9B56|nr:lipopolysaccharide assembly protein LapA domain-containing protein [Amycolatopsis sp. QT-25]WET78937.1 lipopolysaccharide assembly protein LapA domain-containing protein [Amycolatopsis sp. QT-25]
MTQPQESAAEVPVDPSGTAGGGRHGGELDATPKLGRTRVSGTWIAVIVALIVLVFLLVFILQNQDTATVHFLGMSGSMPLAVAMLFSVIAGGALVGLVGGARILQLRKQAKQSRHQPR